jgi:hypothetical protein
LGSADSPGKKKGDPVKSRPVLGLTVALAENGDPDAGLWLTEAPAPSLLFCKATIFFPPNGRIATPFTTKDFE